MPPDPQLVEHFWDPQTKWTRRRYPRSLGQVRPRFIRTDPAQLLLGLPLGGPHFSLLAPRP